MKMFFDRYDAGKQLASQLHLYKDTDSVVLALPRGGVLVGHEIATALNLPLDIVITRKIGHPWSKEMAICAVTEDGQRVCGSDGLYGVDESWIEHESVVATEEAARRRKVFGAPSPRSIKDKTVILTDDGIATGLTMKAALLAIRSQQPKKIVLAVPVGPHEVLEELQTEVDELVVLDTGEDYRSAVGAYYTHFPEVFDKEVIACLKHTRPVQSRLAVPQQA